MRLASGDEKPPLLPPGNYELAFVECQTGVLFGKSAKLILTFSIMTPGEYLGLKLLRYYNVQKIIGRQGKDGRFKVGWHSDFMREYCNLFPAPSRNDRVPMSKFRNTVVLGRVGTVNMGRGQKPIPSVLQYSVIREINELLVGSELSLTPIPRPTPIPTPTLNSQGGQQIKRVEGFGLANKI